MRPYARLSIPSWISGKSEVGKKNNRPDVRRMLIDEGNSVSNPFSKVVLKEKKEEKKKPAAPVERKKPGEIVHGYNPSLSFGDILSSYEKTGDPYRMPKKSSSPSVSFGDILDEWENGGKKKDGKKTQQKEESRSSYTATKSFGDILNQYEGIYREKEAKKPQTQKQTKEDAKAKVSEALRGTSMFLEETEDEKMAEGVSWSVLGGRNPSFVRKEEEKKEEKTDKEKEKKYIRSTPRYSSSVSFASILDEYEGSKAVKRKVEEKTAGETKVTVPGVEAASPVEEPTFFIHDEEESVPSNVSWSILGGRNENFVRPVVEEKKEEPPEEKKKESEKKDKKTASQYTPRRDFGEILSSYDIEKTKKTAEVKTEVPSAEEKKPDVPEPDFFIRDEEETVPSNVSWSILGGRNENYVRPVEKKKEEAPPEEKKEKRVERASDPYQPKESFSSILSSYEKQTEKPHEKTFSEIMEEKGDNRKKKSSLSINDLRRMNVQATLDLHGETQKESEEMISSFIRESVDHGLRKVSIITGKGLHSESGTSVLRDYTLSLLSSSPFVQETGSAPLNRGGSGAIWVILKEKTEE